MSCSSASLDSQPDPSKDIPMPPVLEEPRPVVVKSERLQAPAIATLARACERAPGPGCEGHCQRATSMQDAQRPFHEDDMDASLPPAQAATKEMVQPATTMHASQEKLPTQDHATATASQKKMPTQDHATTTASQEKMPAEGHATATASQKKMLAEGHATTTASQKKMLAEGHATATAFQKKMLAEGHATATAF